MPKINDSEIKSKKNKQINKDINEIDFFRRTNDNYTHEDISDKKITKITSWRKSNKKFLSVLFLNILTLGILHIISKCYPKLYLKLYCNNCSPKYSDFFLVENIYGQCILCQTKKIKKNLYKNDLNNSLEETSKVYMHLFSSFNINKLKISLSNNNSNSFSNTQYININNSPIITFIYNSKLYEYDEIKNIIIPVHLNLEGKTHKTIINIFQGGLSSEYLVKTIRERFGKNEYKININIISIYFQKVEKKLLIYSIICGSLEVAIQDAVSTGIIMGIIILYFIFRKIVISKILKEYNNQDFSLDGQKLSRHKVKRKYLYKSLDDNKIKNEKHEKELKNTIKIANKDKESNGSNNYNIINSNRSSIKYINKGINNEEENNCEYIEIDNCDLLPGDIIYLKNGDYVPCDGIILEGDCIVNEIELNDNLEYTYKTFLKYTNDIFDYKKNKKNILLHGMKISKIYTKRNSFDNNWKNEFITVLCINTGPNTYKANQISNTLDLLKRKKIYQNMYKIISGQRLLFLISVTILFLITVLIPTILLLVKIKKNGLISLAGKESLSKGNNTMNPASNGPPTKNGEEGGPSVPQSQTMDKMQSQSIPEEVKKGIIKGILMNYFLNFFSRAIIKTYMPIYLIVSSFIILLGSYRLYKNNIFCFEKMRLLFAGEINTIFMSKFNILCDDKYEIKGYYPAFQSSKASNITLQTFYKEQVKDFSSIIFSYYNNIKNKGSFLLSNLSKLNKLSGKLSVWLLECLFCCNNLIKIGQNIEGNMIEKNLFQLMKWEIKIVEEENSDFEKYINENDIDNNENDKYDSEDDNNNNNLFYYGRDKEEKYTYNKIIDVYPQSYYKMLDKKNFGYQKIISNFKFLLSQKILKRPSKINKNNLFDNNSLDSNKNNPIIKDLSSTKCSSYKLRIYKKFLTKNSLFSSAIVYNFLVKTLRFMTKGSPEKILPHCLINSLPDDIYKIITDLRKEGYIIIICACKKIDLYSYNDLRNENFYMKNLTFCGLITLKNNIKKQSKIAIEQLQKMNCDIIMNTGDNLYNSIGTGFEIGILDNKKIFAFDFDENQKSLYINNIYRPISFNYEIYGQINEIKKSIRNSTTNKFKRNNKKENSIKKDINNNTPIKYSKINKSRMFSSYFNNNTNNDDSKFSSERAKIFQRSSTFKSYDGSDISDVNISNSNKRNYELNKISNKDIKNKDINKKYSNKKINIFIPQVEYKRPLQSYINLDIKLKKASNDNNKKKNSIENSKQIFKCMNTFEDDTFIKEKLIKEYFANICYYSESLLNYLEKDSIFCVSGKAFNFIYNNKESNKYSKLLNILSKNTKIFFSMTSQDKTLLIDYFRELSNKTTCMVGYGSIDIDSMMTAHVGICLKKPINRNMMLCHFYLPSQNISDIKTIIEQGRVILENFYLLFISCLFCTSIIDFYMGVSFYLIMDVKPEHLRVFNTFFYGLSLLGFTNNADNNENFYLKQKNKLFWKFIIVQFIGNFIIKSYDVMLFFLLYRKNKNIEENKRDIIFISYSAILTFNQILTTIFGFNYISFYRQKFYDNFIFCVSMFIFIIFSIVTSGLSRNGYHSGVIDFYTFEELQEKSDTFDDRNKFLMFIIIFIDLFSTITFISISQYYFNKISKKSLVNDKKEIN